MKVIGAAGVAVTTAEDECPHTPKSNEKFWQESFAMNWFDPETGIGGLNRLGHEPNYEGGRALIWNTIFSLKDGEWFKQTEVVPLRPGDRLQNGMNGGDTMKYRFEDGLMRLTLQDKGVELDVRHHPHHPLISNIPLKDGDTNLFYSGGDRGHFEAAGRLRGTVKIAGKENKIDASVYRNHSWGVRHWDQLRCHRWIAGECGQDFSFAMFGWHTTAGQGEAHGHLIRDGMMIFAEKVDIIVFQDIDGLSHRGAIAHMTLPGGEILKFEVEPICKGTMGVSHDSLVALTAPSRVSVGNRQGICSFEISNNVLGGTSYPKGIINGVTETGLIKVPDANPWAEGAPTFVRV